MSERRTKRNDIESPCSSLHLTPRNGDLEVALQILEQRNWTRVEEFFNPWGEQGVTLAHLAAYCGNLTALKLAPDLEAVDKFDRCPLHYAAEQGHVEAVEWLLECQATNGGPNQTESSSCHQLSRQDLDGMTALHLAVRARHVDVVKILVEAGANVNALNEQGLPPLLLAHCDLDHILPDHNEQLSRYKEIVDIVISAGACVDYIDPESGWTILHFAALLNSQKATQRLVDYEPKLVSQSRSRTGMTPVHVAAARRSNEALCILLKVLSPTMIDMLDEDGWSPLHFAASEDNLEGVRAIVDRAGNLAKKTSEGYTTIHYLSKLKDTVDLVAFFTNILDGNICLIQNDVREPRLKESGDIILDFKVLAPDGEGAPQMSVISDLIEQLPRKLQIRILQHPLIKAYIEMKWSHLRWAFYSLVIVQVLFALDISFYAIYRQDEPAATVLRGMLLFFAGIPFCCKCLEMFTDPSKCYHLRQIEDWLYLLCWTISIIVAVGGEFESNVTTSWIPYCISIVIPIIWIQTTLLVGRLSGWVFYALIFPAVLLNFLKVFVIGLSIVVGFSISFMVLFHSKDVFQNFWQAVVKTVVMMAGEYEFGDLFSNEEESMSDELNSTENNGTYLPFVTRTVFLIYVMLASIVLINFMVGLAVSDIQGLLKEGQFGQLLKQAEFITACERMTNLRIPLVSNLWVCMEKIQVPLISNLWERMEKIRVLFWERLRDTLSSTIDPIKMKLTRRQPLGLSKTLMDDLFNIGSKNQKSQEKPLCHEKEDTLAAIRSMRQEIVAELQQLKNTQRSPYLKKRTPSLPCNPCAEK